MAPVYDFSGAFRNLNDSISGLGKSFEEAALKKQRAGIGEDALAGNFSGAAAKAFKAGDFDSGLKFLGMGREQTDNAFASQNMPSLLGGAQFGQPAQNPIDQLGAQPPAGLATPMWSQSGSGLSGYSLYGGPGGTVGKPSASNAGGGTLGGAGSYNPNGQQPAFARAQPIGPSRDFNAMFSTAEQQYGLPAGYLGRTAQIESSMNPNAANPGSSARGLFQFIGSTAKQYGLADPFDPAASTDAAGRLAMDNANILRRGLGREPTGPELYLAHQQGAGGALKLLASPNVRAADVVGEKAVRLNGGDPNMTAGQFAGLWMNKFGGQQGQGGDQPTQMARANGPTPDQARAGIARVDMLLNDPNQELSPAQRQSLEQRREQYVQVAQGGQPGQQQADMPAQGAMEAQQAFQIPGTGQVVPAGTRLTPRAMVAIKVMSGNASAGWKKAAELALQEELKNANPATQLDLRNKQLQNQKLERELAGEGATPLTAQEREAYGLRPDQPAYRTRDGAIKFGPAGTTINNNMPDKKGETKFAETLGAKQAERWNNYITEGDVAQGRMADIQTLRETSRRLGSQGAAGNLKAIIGPYAESLGIKMEGLPDIQLYSSIVNRLAPKMREPGSGSTSNIEFEGFVRAIGPLSNTPAAREMILDTFEAATRNDLARAEIATRLATGEISRGQAERDLRALPSPLEAYRAFKKANPDLVGEAIKASAQQEFMERKAQREGAQQSQQPAALGPSPEAVQHLKTNPQFRDQFDARYGAGAAARAMGGR